MEEDNKFGLTDHGMMVCVKMIKLTSREHLFTQMVTFMKECGLMIKLTVKAHTSTQMEQHI